MASPSRRPRSIAKIIGLLLLSVSITRSAGTRSLWFIPAVYPAAATPSKPSPLDLVEVRRIAPGIRVDLRYATADNVFGRRLYQRPRCLLRRAVAERLARVQRRLARHGYGLKIWDAYRPRSVQRVMWRIHPRGGYVGDPWHGSNHNRGAAVDLTLVRADGRPVAMPTGYDHFGPRAHLSYAHLPKAVRENRARLVRAMRAEGFRPYRREWWHFVAPDYRRYPMVDVPL
jgi:D-alanyl-D-alanine dipeptidase